LSWLRHCTSSTLALQLLLLSRDVRMWCRLTRSLWQGGGRDHLQAHPFPCPLAATPSSSCQGSVHRMPGPSLPMLSGHQGRECGTTATAWWMDVVVQVVEQGCELWRNAVDNDAHRNEGNKSQMTTGRRGTHTCSTTCSSELFLIHFTRFAVCQRDTLEKIVWLCHV
jgi:hypothetical protein